MLGSVCVDNQFVDEIPVSKREGKCREFVIKLPAGKRGVATFIKSLNILRLKAAARTNTPVYVHEFKICLFLFSVK